MQTLKGQESPKIGPLFISIVALFVILRIWNLTAYDLWLDELLCLEAARQSIAGLFQFAIVGVVHPPLFYLLAKIWIAIGGESLLWLKLLPLTAAILTIVPFCFLCRELKISSGEMNLALFLIAVNSYLITYSQDFGRYSLVLLFTVTSLWLFVRFLNTQRGLIVIFLVNLLLVYTHYYGWLVVGTEFLFVALFSRELLSRFIITIALLFLAFSPWAYLTASTAVMPGGMPDLGWIARPDIQNLVLYYATLSGLGPSRYLAVAGLALFTLLIGFKLLRADRNVWLLLLLSTLPVAVSFIVSQKAPVWHVRYLIISAAPFLLLAAVCVFSLPKTVLKATVVIVVLWTSFSGLYGITHIDKVNWGKLAAHVNQVDPSASTVFAFGQQQTAVPLRYYLDSRFNVVEVTELPDLDRYWVAYRESRGQTRTSLEDEARSRGHVVGDIIVDGVAGHQAHVFLVTR